MNEFSGKVALVTGAGSGIGEACALALAERGARVVVADLNEDSAQRVTAKILEADGEAEACIVDVTVPASVEKMVAFVVEHFGGLDLAVNNAGINGDYAPVGEYSLDTWAKVIDVNLNGVFYSLRYEIPAMLERGGGSIVNMSSVLGSVAAANTSAYVTAKHGVTGLTKSAALDYASKGIRVNSVGPGFVDTPLLGADLSKLQRSALNQLQPIKRIARTDEIASLVAFLLSDAASFITGSYHIIDGGYTAQ